MNTIIIADIHAHIYPCYNLGRLLDSAVKNVQGLPASSDTDERVIALCLTERHDCSFFRDVKKRRVPLPVGYTIVDQADETAIAIKGRDNERVHIIAGRQIVTRERIEVLALAVDLDQPDGQPARQVINHVQNANGVPVLPWSPGKWFFKRGKLIKELLDTRSPDEVVLGDTTLRPTLWPEPRLMRYARTKGFKVIAGSDPLPFPDEEDGIGRYATVAEGPFDPQRPSASIRRILQDTAYPVLTVGRRDSPFQAARRLYKNYREARMRGRAPNSS